MTMALLRLLALSLATSVVHAGHNDMFGCRGKACDVTELTEANWASTIAATPHFIMFYAPWCGHCKQLAPKLKGAAKKAKAMGFGIGAVDVEPNPSIQSLFPDIRGFPSLKYVNNAKGKKSIDYNGAREGDAILEWTKETFMKTGGVPTEPVEAKAWDQLYTFLGRAALDDKPALLAVGTDKEPPAWVAKLHGDLKETPKDAPKESPEAETKRLLAEAKKATKLPEVREGIVGVLETLDMAEKAKSKKSKPLFATTWSGDAATLAAFNASDVAKGSAHVYAVALDRKDLAKSLVLPFPGNPVVAKRGKIDAAAISTFAKDAADAAGGGVGAFAAAYADAVALPDVPKPKSVLAAEERARAKKARAAAVNAISSKADLDAHCYALAGSKTCVLGVGDVKLDDLATKFAKEGFAFASIAADAPIAEAMLGDGGSAPALVVVKGGKRARAARAFGVDAFSGLLDSVLGGGASFTKFSGGLPQWPEAEAASGDAEEGEGDEYDL